jgi:hypothetical protein
MGGAPILSIDEEGRMTVVGVNTKEIETAVEHERKVVTCGRLITEDLLFEFRKEAFEMGAEPFKVMRI